MSVDVSRCRSCGASIYWLANAATGKRAPIEAAPSAKGNIGIDLEAETYSVAFGQSGPGFYLNHFVTCPNAAHWKERGAR